MSLILVVVGITFIVTIIGLIRLMICLLPKYRDRIYDRCFELIIELLLFLTAAHFWAADMLHNL